MNEVSHKTLRDIGYVTTLKLNNAFQFLIIKSKFLPVPYFQPRSKLNLFLSGFPDVNGVKKISTKFIMLHYWG